MNTQKMACSREPFTVDWSNFYEKFNIDVAIKPITSSVWHLSDGVKGAEFVSSALVTVFIDGGTPGVVLTAKNTIEINGGEYRDCRTIYIEVV